MRRAFTLLELMLVLALIVVLSALSIPMFSSMEAHYKVTAAADTLKSGYADARGEAIDGGRPYRFAVLEGKSNYRIAPDSDNFWSGGSTVDEFGGEVVIIEGALPNGIVFNSTNDLSSLPGENENTVVDAQAIAGGQWKTLAVFLADGTADQDRTVTLQCHGSAPIVVHLRGLTGSVTTRIGAEVEEQP